MSDTYSQRIADWALSIAEGAIPADVVQATKYRILDVIGLALAGSRMPFGRSVRQSMVALHGGGPCRLLGTGDRVGVSGAAFGNGAFSQAMEFDDTHNESIVHMSSPAVAAALALAEWRGASGMETIAAVAVGNEISCRVGSVSPGQFHKRGFHPTGLFAPFGTTVLAGRMMKLDKAELANALGIAGSLAAGILECWVDGTQSKFLHPGWAAQSGIAAASLGDSGATGPAAVFEGRFGFFASHLQDGGAKRDFDRMVRGLGTEWESRRASLKPFPAAHVIHPYIDAVLKLRSDHGFKPVDIVRVRVPVAQYIVGIVCEPLSEKLAPQSDSHGRVSLQYTLAEAIARGELGAKAYQPQSLTNPEILSLASRIDYEVDPSMPGPERFKGVVEIELKDGRRLTHVEEFNRGSAENPMSRAEILAKFEENAEDAIPAAAAKRIIEAVDALDRAPSAGKLVDLAIRDS